MAFTRRNASRNDGSGWFLCRFSRRARSRFVKLNEIRDGIDGNRGEIAWNVAQKTQEFLKDRKELHDWWDSVRAGDSERLRILFLAGFTRPDQPDPLEPAIQTIALELAVRRGDWPWSNCCWSSAPIPTKERGRLRPHPVVVAVLGPDARRGPHDAARREPKARGVGR